MLTFPDINPVAFAIGPLAVRWYALAYIAGILIGWWYIGRIDRRAGEPMLTDKAREDMVTWAIIGVLLGGRLGYILFYNAPYYFSHPGEALKVWQGGMSFHGGLAGVLIAFWLYARRGGLQWLPLMDRIACATPIGLFFGRLANFVNGELYGRPTGTPWGMVFPGGGPEPRHPSQLYEAGLEGLVLFLTLFLLARYTRLIDTPGRLGGVFLAGYGLSRFTVEFFRQPDDQLGLLVATFSMGQLLCLPMIAAGLWLMVRRMSVKTE